MKLTTPYELFERAVATVNANAVANIVHDICQYVLIQTNKDNQSVTLTKSDLDVHITSSTKAVVETPGQALVHGEHLLKILKTYKNLKKSDDCNVVITSDSQKVTIGFTDNKKYKPAVLSTQDPDHFAEIPVFENEIATCDITGFKLYDYFAKNLIAINKHESNNENAGVFFKFKGDEIELVSSNRQEVVVNRDKPIKADYPASADQTFALIPRKTMETASKIIKGAFPVQVSISVDMVKISGDIDGVLFSVINNTLAIEAAIDGEAMIPKDSSTVISVPTQELKNALAHMEAIMDKSSPHRITIQADAKNPDIVTLSCKSPTGEIPGLPINAKVEKAPASGASPLILNDQRLTSLLKVTRANNIRISYGKPGEICTFKSDEEPHFTLIAGTLEPKTGDIEKAKPQTDTAKPAADLSIIDYDDLSAINDVDDLESSLEGIGGVEF